MECSGLIWKAAHTPSRDMILSLWESCDRNDSDGIWQVFSRYLGDAAWSSWKHQCRLMARYWWARRAGETPRELMRINWTGIKRLVGKETGRSGSSRTLLSGAHLTLGMQNRFFGDVDSRCMYCNTTDTQLHRICWCPRMDESRRRVGWGPNDEDQFVQGGLGWASRGVCLIPESLCVPSNPMWNPLPYLDLMSGDDVDLVSTYPREDWEIKVVVRRWKATPSIVAANILFLGTSRCWNCSGLSVEDVYHACMFRYALMARIARVRCRIQVDADLSRASLLQWIRSDDKPWTFLRKLLSPTDLDWVQVARVDRDRDLDDELALWGARNGVQDIQESARRQLGSIDKLRAMASDVGDLYCATGAFAHRQKRARVR